MRRAALRFDITSKDQTGIARTAEHSPPKVCAEFGAEIRDRFTVHYTPAHGSWLNQADIEIGIFSRHCLGRRRIPDLKVLRKEVRAWNRRITRAGTKIEWKFDRKTARRKFGYKPTRSKRSQT